MKKNLSMIIICILAVGLISGCSNTWNKTFGGSGNDEAWSVQQTKDGGYILAGYTTSYGAGSEDAWLIKTNANGIEEWNKTFGGSGDDQAYSVQQTKDGGYILAGETRSYGAGNADAWLIKTDANGIEEWNKTFGGSGDDQAYSVQQTSDGGYILAGSTRSFGSGSRDAWLIKTDANGIEQWNKTFGGSGDDQANSVQQTKDGGYILAGETRSYGAGNADVWLIKTDANGIEEWNKTFGDSGWDASYSVQQTKDGGYILAGETPAYSAANLYAWLIKTDANGIEEWNRTFGLLGHNGAHSVQQTNDGGYILAGWTDLFSIGRPDAWLIKTGACGIEHWNKTFGFLGDNAALSVQQTKDGGYILAGRTDSFGASYRDALLIKTDATGIAPPTPTP
jgi:hypothetical protein